MPLLQTSGNVTADGYGGGVAAVPNYIEDVFSTYLYSGTGSALTITNGIDLSGKGGMTWIKNRPYGYDNSLFDTARGANKWLISNSTAAQANSINMLDSFNSNGFTLGTDAYTGGAVNVSGSTYASWTFRKQAKFFDVVTYTGNGTAGRTVAHNLGSVPGSIIVKSTSSLTNWHVYHRSLAVNQNLLLDLTQAARTDNSFNSTAPTATVFSLGGGATNTNGETYVAYLFAHNAGGFGLTGTDNVISCGSFTTDGSGNFTPVDLGYEPQWLLVKRTNSSGYWNLVDTMRGFNLPAGSDVVLFPNAADAEGFSGIANPTATGFGPDLSTGLSASSTYIYIAIRRGPMKVPTSGTSVFSPTTNAGTGSQKTVTTNFPVDLTINSALSAATHVFTDRLRGGGVNVSPRLYSQFTDAETNTSSGRGILFDSNTGFTLTSNYINASGDNYIYYGMRRAPSFFDEVCYTAGGSSAQTYNHNLGVSPELIIVKKRSSASTDGWWVGSQFGSTTMNQSRLNATAAGNTVAYTSSSIFAGAPTSTTFTVGNYTDVGDSGSTYVAYLFATCAGVSKVGSYTGNGSTQTINCGFTGGARFVLIKRTDSTGDWYVYDTARGMTVLTDPYLLLNSTAAESATLGSVTTVSTGFAVNASILAAINTNAASYIFLAIA